MYIYIYQIKTMKLRIYIREFMEVGISYNYSYYIPVGHPFIDTS